MKRIIISLAAIAAIVASSCNKEAALNKGPLDLYSDNTVWQDSALISRVVLQAYAQIHSIYDDAGNWMPCDITDEAKVRTSFSQANQVNSGQYSASNAIYGGVWINVYRAVRNCNTILEHLPDMPLSENSKNRIKGEMLFLRALQYSSLYSIFGPFPIIDKALSLDDPELYAPRGSDADCLKFMIDDLDNAASLLPESYTDGTPFGRATKYAAVALKCRLLLNAKDYERAGAAAKDIIDHGLYSLFPDYAAMFFPENDGNQEVIFAKGYGSEQSGQTHSLDVYGNAPKFTGFGSVRECPTQNLVDQYLMTDGKPWNESPLYDPAHPYNNRDPRLQASIMYDGTSWMGTTIDMKIGSLFNPTGSNSPTGYQMRKFLNPNYIFYGNNPNYQDCIMLRLGEIYLNYAECMLKQNNPEEARKYINKLRERAHMIDVKEGEMTWDVYVRERTVELAFEGQRWNDIRRWQTGPAMIGAKIYAVKIEDGTGGRTYTPTLLEQRYFDPKMYYFPIPQSERNTYPAGQVLEQNPGWSN